MEPETATRTGAFPRSSGAILVTVLLLACAWIPAAAAVTAAGPGDKNALFGPTSPKAADYLILSTVDDGDPFYAAAEALQAFRGGEIVVFDPEDLDALLTDLKTREPRYVAVVAKPMQMHINFTRSFLMMATMLDDDPFTDFSWGYISGGTAQDAVDFVNNIKRAEQDGIQDKPLKVGGYSASSISYVFTSASSYMKYLNPTSYSDINMEVNDTGSGLDFFHQNSYRMLDNKVLDIGHNGDPHMVWLFDGGNFDPDPPIWSYDPAKIENPAYARVGLTSNNISELDLYPAVAINGACHGGVLKQVLVESDIMATFGNTQGQARFYTMSDDFSFAINILRSNITGYFAPNGANNANDAGEDLYNAFLYDEPLGDIHKRSHDGVVMGFLGNRPNLRLFEEGDSIYMDDVLESGTFDPSEWSGSIMLGGKANRIYFGDPLFDPFADDHDERLNITSTTLTEVDGTTLDIDIAVDKPSVMEAYFPIWDKFHYYDTRIYTPIELPEGFGDIASVEVVSNSGPYHKFIHALEHFDGKDILHVEIDLPDDMYDPIDYDMKVRVKIPETFDIDILTPDLNGTASPGEKVTYEFEVQNDGNTNDDVTLSFDPPSSGWTMDVDFDGTDIPSGMKRKATVDITPPAGAFAGATMVKIIEATSGGDAGMTDIITITTKVRAVHSVGLSGTDLALSTDPGVAAQYDFEVSNNGNGPDRFEVGHGPVADGWTVDLTFDNGSMDPLETRTASVTVTPPDSALAGTTEDLTVSVQRTADPNISDSLTLSTTVDRVRGVGIEEGATEATTLPSMAVEYEMTVVNKGNDVDVIDLTSAEMAEGWSVKVVFDGADMAAREERTATVTVTPPEGVAEGEGEQVVITASLPDAPAISDTVTLTTTVAMAPAVSVVGPADMDILPEGSVTMSFKVRNDGNGEDTMTFSAEVDKAGWVASLTGGGSMGMKLGAGVEGTVGVVATAPSGAVAGTVAVVTLKAGSGYDANITATAASNITVLAVHDISISASDAERTITTKEVADFRVRIDNGGNSKVEVTVEVVGTHKEWARLSLDRLTLELGGNSTVDITVEPVDARPGDYIFVVMAKAGEDTESVELKVTVTKKDDGGKVDVEDGTGLWAMLIILIVIFAIAVVVSALYLRRRGMDGGSGGGAGGSGGGMDGAAQTETESAGPEGYVDGGQGGWYPQEGTGGGEGETNGWQYDERREG